MNHQSRWLSSVTSGLVSKPENAGRAVPPPGESGPTSPGQDSAPRVGQEIAQACPTTFVLPDRLSAEEEGPALILECGCERCRVARVLAGLQMFASLSTRWLEGY